MPSAPPPLDGDGDGDDWDDDVSGAGCQSTPGRARGQWSAAVTMEGMDPVACGAPDRSIRLHNGEGKEVVVVEEVDLAAATTMTTTTIMMMTLATITTTIARPQQGSSGSASTLPLLDLAKV